METIKVGETTLRVNKFKARHGFRVFTRLSKTIGPALIAGAGDEVSLKYSIN